MRAAAHRLLAVAAIVGGLAACGHTSPGAFDGGSGGFDAGRCGINAVECQGECVDVSSSNAHCGACGVACASGQGCLAGRCVETCAGGSGRVCEGGCVNPQSDELNCGACDHACPSGTACQAGACTVTCGPLLMPCPVDGGSACVDSNSDQLNCGACGHTCPAGTSCQSGACVTTCAAPLVSCPTDAGAACTSLTDSMANCGSCGVACKATETCITGVCVDACKAAGSWRCFGQCVNLSEDDANCGVCGTSCFFPTHCHAGQCVSPVGVCTSTIGLPNPPPGPYMFDSAVGGNFEGNGRLDVVADNGGSGSLTLWFNDGHGRFDAGPSIVGGTAGSRLAAADLDKDGLDDLIEMAGSPVVFLNDGGTLTSETVYPLGAGYGYEMAVTDVDGDGFPDIVVPIQQGLLSTTDETAVLYNDGTGHFPRQATYATSSVGYPTQILAGDINGDGHTDILLLSDSVLLQLNDGDGGLLPATAIAPNASAIALGDMNGDGSPDLVSVSAHLLEIRLNDGVGDLGVPSQYALPLLVGATQLALNDFDGDGLPDVFAVSGAYQDGMVSLTNDGQGGLRDLRWTWWAGPGQPPVLLAGDVNGDGLDDVLFGVEGDMHVLLGVRGLGLDAAWAVVPVSYLYALGGQGVAVADMNGDGRPSLVAAVDEEPNQTSTGPQFTGIQAWAYDAGGWALTASFDAGDRFTSIAVGRLNADVISDVVALGSGVVTVFLSEADGGYARQDIQAQTNSRSPIALGDFDCDGWPDVVYGTPTGFALLMNQHGAGFALGPSFPASATYLAAGDLDQDGCADIVAGGYGLTVWLGLPDGGFNAATTVSTQVYSFINVSDVDGDGRPDVLYGDSTSLWILSGGLPPARQAFATEVDWFGVADLNGDGSPDIAVLGVNYATGSIWLNDGTGNFSYAQAFDAIAFLGLGGPPSVSLADFDGDGRPALIPNGGSVVQVAPTRCLP